MISQRFALTSLLLILVLIAGCVTESSSPVTTSTTTSPILRATITGKIVDMCTGQAIAGAVMSVGYDGGVSSTTSDASGSYSFGNVPVSRYETVGGNIVSHDNYTITASLVNYNHSQTDTSKRYRDFYYHISTLTYTNGADSANAIGLIGSVYFSITELRSVIQGKIVDQDNQPVPSAIVTLYDQTIIPGAVIRQARTDANGDYHFVGVDNGITVSISAMSSDGSLSGSLLAALALPCNLPTDSIRSQVIAERIMITPKDNVAPTVISTSPANNADVDPATAQIVYTFSEPIKQTPYTRTDLGIGHATIVDDIHVTYVSLKKAAADVGFSAQWNSSFTQLQITPRGLVGSANYTFNFVTAAGKLQDLSGNALANNLRLTGDFEVLNFTTAGTSPIPSAPVLSRRLIPGLYVDLNFTGGTVSLEWPSDANARSFNVYRQVGTGSSELLASAVLATQYVDVAPALVTPYNAGLGIRDPMRAQTVQYTVRGVSRDLVEGAASNAIAVSDAVKPQLTNAGRAFLVTNSYSFTLSFNEPLPTGVSENVTNYTFSNTGGVTYTISRADYLGYSAGSYIVRLTVATSAVPVAGAVLTIGSNITDMAGNAIDSAFNSFTF